MIRRGEWMCKKKGEAFVEEAGGGEFRLGLRGWRRRGGEEEDDGDVGGEGDWEEDGEL